MTQIDLSNLPERGAAENLPNTPPEPMAGDVYEPPTAVQHKTDLDVLREDMAAELDDEVLVPVLGRPGYTVQFKADITSDELDGWKKAAKSKRHTDGIDGAKLTRLVVANKCVAILREGERLVDEYGDPLIFRHRELLDMLGVKTAADAAFKFYGRDGDVDSAARAVLVASGWGDELTPDPTRGSSSTGSRDE